MVLTFYSNDLIYSSLYPSFHLLLANHTDKNGRHFEEEKKCMLHEHVFLKYTMTLIHLLFMSILYAVIDGSIF